MIIQIIKLSALNDDLCEVYTFGYEFLLVCRRSLFQNDETLVNIHKMYVVLLRCCYVQFFQAAAPAAAMSDIGVVAFEGLAEKTRG